MSRIEQMGGYELAKQVFDSVPKDGNSYTVTRDDTGASFHSGEIFKALLEYRRANSIFEVGDKVVSKYENLNLFGDVVLEIEYFRKLSSVVWVCFTNENYYLVDALRHATDEEIATGYRGAK